MAPPSSRLSVCPRPHHRDRARVSQRPARLHGSARALCLDDVVLNNHGEATWPVTRRGVSGMQAAGPADDPPSQRTAADVAEGGGEVHLEAEGLGQVGL